MVYIVVLTWYIPGIYRLYLNIGDLAGIYHTKTSMHLFGTSHVPPSTSHIPGYNGDADGKVNDKSTLSQAGGGANTKEEER